MKGKKITAVIFTYPRDYEMAGIAARSLRNAGASVYFAIDRGDKALHIDGGGIVRTAFPRKGNLNGMACAEGILDTMGICAEADGSEWVVKVDSDTFVHSLAWLDVDAGKQVVGTGHDPAKNDGRTLYGACYGVRSSFLPEFRAHVRKMGERTTRAEDLMMGNAAQDLGVLHRYVLHKDGHFGPHVAGLSPAGHLGKFEAVCVQRANREEDARKVVAGKMRALFMEKWNAGVRRAQEDSQPPPKR